MLTITLSLYASFIALICRSRAEDFRLNEFCRSSLLSSSDEAVEDAYELEAFGGSVILLSSLRACLEALDPQIHFPTEGRDFVFEAVETSSSS